jgi:hypothetical protein
MDNSGNTCCSNPFDQQLNSYNSVQFDNETLTGNLTVDGSISGSSILVPAIESKSFYVDDSTGARQTQIVEDDVPANNLLFKDNSGDTFMRFDPSFGGKLTTQYVDALNTVVTPVLDLPYYQILCQDANSVSALPFNFTGGPIMSLAQFTSDPPPHTNLFQVSAGTLVFGDNDSAPPTRTGDCQMALQRYDYTTRAVSQYQTLNVPNVNWSLGVDVLNSTNPIYPTDGSNFMLQDYAGNCIMQIGMPSIDVSNAMADFASNLLVVDGNAAKTFGASQGVAILQLLRGGPTDTAYVDILDADGSQEYIVGMGPQGTGGNDGPHDLVVLDSTANLTIATSPQGSGQWVRPNQISFGMTTPYTNSFNPQSSIYVTSVPRTVSPNTFLPYQQLVFELQFSYQLDPASTGFNWQFSVGGFTLGGFTVTQAPTGDGARYTAEYSFNAYIVAVNPPNLTLNANDKTFYYGSLPHISPSPATFYYQNTSVVAPIDATLSNIIDCTFSSNLPSDSFTVNLASGRLIC